MTTLTIYGFAPSTYTQTARLVAHEAGAPAELAPLEFKRASHLSLHPYGKMPALRHGELTLFETLAVATYLDRVFGAGALQPSDPTAFARMAQWVSVAIDYAYEDLVSQLHDDAPSAQATTAAAEQLKLLDAGLGSQPYFAGAQLSLADLFLYPMVAFARAKLGALALQELPALRRFCEVMEARASVQSVLS